MKELQTLAAFEKHIDKLIAEFPIYEAKASHFLGEILTKEAKDKIGHLNEGWKQLADSTKLDKERKGYVFNADYNPLQRTNVLKESIHSHFDISTHTLFLGSSSDVMIYHEYGTRNMPARPVISTTMFQATGSINYVMGSMMFQFFSGEKLSLRKGTYGSV